MDILAQQVISGVTTGAVYACTALAIVLIFQAIGHINFAQGEMATFSTFLSWQMLQWGVPYWIAFVTVLALSFLGGFLIERVLFRPLARAPALTKVAGFIGLFAIINSASGVIWDFNIKQYPSPFGAGPFMGSRMLSNHEAGVLGVVVLLLAGLFAFLRLTRVGLAMRAAALLPESARLVGVNTDWTAGLGWGMAATVGAVGGMLIAPVVFLDPNMMGGILVYGFAAAVLGGLSSPAGAVVGGLAVGVIENLVGTFVPGVGQELRLPIALALIVTVLVVKPSGLFGQTTTRRV